MHSLAGLLERSRARQDDLVDLFHRLHRRPETGLVLPQTQAMVLEALRDLPLEVRTGRTNSAVVARLACPRAGADTVLLRADMDALPLQEESGLSYASEVPGVMHACGHDAHVAMLVAAAHLLAASADELPVNVVFLFQPGEEGHDGCRAVLAEGLLDGSFRPTRAYALHQNPALPSGLVATKPGALLAGADGLRVTVRGRGGHVGLPHLATDPVPVLCAIVMALQQVVARQVDVFDPAVVTVNRLQAGELGIGAIPAIAVAEGTLRTFSESTRARLWQGVRDAATHVAAAHGCEADVEIAAGYPPTVNDAEEAGWSLGVAAQVAGHERTQVLPTPVPASEDFSYLLQQVPGAMLLLGTRPAGGEPAPVHSARMRLDEEALPLGAAVLAGLALAPR